MSVNRKPFWRRVNRGLVVSMALLAAVIVYVLITQLMLIPEREQITKISDEFRELMESTSALDQQKTSSLKDEQALKGEISSLKERLSKLFVEDSAYIDEAVQYLADNIQRQVEDIEQITKQSAGKKIEQASLIDQDIAKTTSNYVYTVSGEYNNPADQKTEVIEDAQRQLHLSINFKKVGKHWKIYRISNVYWDSLINNHYKPGGRVYMEVK